MSRLAVVAVCGGLLAVAGAQEPADPVAALVAQLEGREPKGRRRAARELGRRGGEQAIRALRQALRDSAEPVRHEAAVALARLASDDPELVEILIESLRNEDWYVRWQACLALRALGPRARDAVPVLLEVLCDAKLDIGREATLALSTIAPNKREVVDTLLKALESRHAIDRRTVAFALDRAGGTGLVHAIPWLAREAHSNEHGVGRAARRLLERSTHAHAEHFLMLFDPDEASRIRAVRWIAGGARDHYRYPRLELALPVLVVALEDDSWRVRWRVLEALRSIGADARPAVPSIVRSTVSVHRSVRYSARRALKTIAPSLARVIDVRADQEKEGAWVARVVFPDTPSREAGAPELFALLLDPAVGDATLAALAHVAGRAKEDLLEDVRAEAAREHEIEPEQGTEGRRHRLARRAWQHEPLSRHCG